MSQTLKIAIPMAGLGTRMRPHTWSKPKPLIALAGHTVLDYVVDQFNTLPEPENVEFIFIVGPNQGSQVAAHMQQFHPDKVVHFVVQEQMRGQSDALFLAREHLHGPMLMAFSDTLIGSDLSVLQSPDFEAAAWVKSVPDPRRFGVAQVNEQGWVTRLVEKPQGMDNNLALVGFYYFSEGARLIDAIEEQMRLDLTLKGEYFLTDAINLMLNRGLRMRTREVDYWLDAGVPEALLETNRFLLENGHDNSEKAVKREGVVIIPPVFIHETARVTSSVIGPYVSIAANCEIESSILSNSILEEDTQVRHFILNDSLLGRQVQVQGQVMKLNLGDNSWTMR